MSVSIKEIRAAHGCVGSSLGVDGKSWNFGLNCSTEQRRVDKFRPISGVVLVARTPTDREEPKETKQKTRSPHDTGGHAVIVLFLRPSDDFLFLFLLCYSHNIGTQCSKSVPLGPTWSWGEEGEIKKKKKKKKSVHWYKVAQHLLDAFVGWHELNVTHVKTVIRFLTRLEPQIAKRSKT